MSLNAGSSLGTDVPQTPLDILRQAKIQELEHRHKDLCAATMCALDDQRLSGTLTDLTVHVGTRQFQCHRAVLVASSPYFQALLRHEPDFMSSSVLSLDQVSADGFERVLSYIYRGTVLVNANTAVQILEAADFLQFRSLAAACSRFLLQHISTNNALSLLELGMGHSFPGLAQASRRYIMEEFHQVMRTPTFLKLTPDALEDLLSDKDISIPSDEHLLGAICQWGVQCEDRKVCLTSVLRHVRMCNITHDAKQTFLVEYRFLEKFFQDLVGDVDGAFNHTTRMPSITTPNDAQDLNVPVKRHRKELIIVIPRDTTSHLGLRQLTLLYHCVKDQKWKPLTKLPFDNRSMFSVSVLRNRIYVLGGHERDIPTKQCHVYDLDSGEWSSIAAMICARSQHSSLVVDGKIYVVGGRCDADSQEEYLADAESYSPESNQWVTIKGNPHIRSIFRPALVPYDDKILVIGGSQIIPDLWGKDNQKCTHTGVYSLDAKTSTWETDEELSRCLKDHNISVGMGDCFVIEGMIMLIDEDTRGKKIRIYNPLDQSMSSLISSHGQHRFAGYLYRHNVLYCTGGLAYLNAPNDMVHAVDLSATTGWNMMATLPEPHSHHACVLLHQ